VQEIGQNYKNSDIDFGSFGAIISLIRSTGIYLSINCETLQNCITALK